MSETKLLDIKSDYIFKLVFGAEKNKKVLISLLNAILKGNPKITDLQLRNSEIPKIIKDNKTIRLDVKAEINPQQFVDIEIQVQNTGEIVERAIQCVQSMSVENFRLLTEEEKNAGVVQSYRYPKVIGIWILGDRIFRDCDQAVTEAGWVRNNHPGFMTDKMRLFFIELPKFNPKTMDKRNLLDVWMAFLKDPLFNSECDIPEVHRAFDTLREISADQDVRDTYQLRMETEFGYLSAKNVAVQNAREEEREIAKRAIAKVEEEKAKAEEALATEKAKAEEALAQEKAKAEQDKITMVKSMLSAGLSIEQVSQISELSVEELRRL